LPSSTHRASGTQFTFGPSATHCFQYALFVVARRPSSTPERESNPGRLHLRR
jgi:hypothetical protein